jgi:hypothetical protein
MPKPKDKWYHTIFKVPSKEEIDRKYEELLEKANARRLRKNERFLQEEGDECSSS